MSLEGTLETIALPDVLALLSVTTKTGELRVEADGGDGSLWLDGGRVSGFEVGKNQTAVDAFFSLLRLRSGSFRFHTDGRPANPVEPLDVGPVLEEAEGRLLEWPSIVAVVPSLSATAKLNPAVAETVVLTPEQWGLVATIGSGRRVGDVLDERQLGEFDGCRALKELVDLNLVAVEAGEAPSAPPPPPQPVTSSNLFTSSFTPVPADPAPETDTAADGLAEAGSLEEEVPAATPDVEAAAAAGLSGWVQDLRQGPAADAAFGDVDDRPAGDEASAESAGGPARIEFTDDVWREPGEEVEVEPDAPVAAEPAERGEPVNRGLLLKFLGSARN